MSSMCAGCGVSSAGMTISTMSSRPEGAIASRTRVRIATPRGSAQSWTMCDSR